MNKNTFFKLYSGDYSQEGYEFGMKASKNRHAKNMFTFVKAVNPINYAWKFNDAFDSFTKNYDIGYLDGQRFNHQVYRETQITGNTMASADNYINHLRMLDEVKLGLGSLRRYLREIEQKYKQQIDSAEAAGFMQDYTDKLKQKHQRFLVKIETVTVMIEKHDAQIEQHKEFIQRLKEMAQNTD